MSCFVWRSVWWLIVDVVIVFLSCLVLTVVVCLCFYDWLIDWSLLIFSLSYFVTSGFQRILLEASFGKVTDRKLYCEYLIFVLSCSASSPLPTLPTLSTCTKHMYYIPCLLSMSQLPSLIVYRLHSNITLYEVHNFLWLQASVSFTLHFIGKVLDIIYPIHDQETPSYSLQSFSYLIDWLIDWLLCCVFFICLSRCLNSIHSDSDSFDQAGFQISKSSNLTHPPPPCLPTYSSLSFFFFLCFSFSFLVVILVCLLFIDRSLIWSKEKLKDHTIYVIFLLFSSFLFSFSFSFSSSTFFLSFFLLIRVKLTK